MSATLSVPEELREAVGACLEAEAVQIEIVSEDAAAVRVVQSAERQQCDHSMLHAGGWITCPTARAMAGRLGIEGRQLGKLLDVLKIKIRQCELGCFE